MGFVGSLLGGGASGGVNHQTAGADPGQMQQAYNNTEGSLEHQLAFAQALQANQPGAIQNQAMLGNLLAQQAQGMGPNPAQAQFQQNMNQTAAQTAGLIGSQKGISPALASRLIAQQGADAKQNAAGQAATLQAQQQLGAQQNLANFTGQQVGQQQNALNAYSQGALGQQGNLLGLQENANSANSAMAQQSAQQQGKIAGGLLGGAGAAIGGIYGGSAGAKLGASIGQGFAHGGEVGGQSHFSQYLANGGKVPINGEAYANQMKPVPGKANVAGNSLKNDTVPAKLSPGEVIIPRSVMESDDPAANAAKFIAAIMAKKGRGLPK